MNVSAMEIMRARRALEEFCAKRNTLADGSGIRLCCDQQDDELFISESGPLQSSSGEGKHQPLVRLSYMNGLWLLFWPREGGGWDPYPPLPRADSIEAVIAEFEQAPVHVHWH